MGKFFMSYARVDQAFTLRLAADLRSAGAEVWVDQFDILPSERWDRAVEAAVRECSGLILVMSPRSVASENVLDEISVALDSGKPVIPVLYERCVAPLRLARVQMIDATHDYDAALARCTAMVLGLQAGARPQPTAQPQPPAPISPRHETLVGWAPAVLADAEKRLAAQVGPIAKVLVEKAAAQAQTETELYDLLARAIPDEAERRKFLGPARREHHLSEAAAEKAYAPNPTFDPAYLGKVGQVLTHYLGPIAPHIVTGEQHNAADREDLWRRLAARIPGDRERTELIAKLRAL